LVQLLLYSPAPTTEEELYKQWLRYIRPCPVAVSPRGAPSREAGRSNYSATPADPSVSIPQHHCRKIRPLAMPILLGQLGFTSQYPCKKEEQNQQTLGSCGKPAPSRACCIWHWY
jgi:hypothetical protein